jgi:ADP-heptose:LPS heptosyltransferase
LRILVLCLDNLGDLVFASSLIPPLQKLHPKATWAVFCKAYAQDIAQAFQVPAEVIAADPPWDDAPGSGKGSYLAFIKAVSRARQWRPDVILVASKNWRAAATAYGIGGTTRIGFDAPKARPWLTNAVSRDGWDVTPVTTMLSRLLRPLGVPAAVGAPPVVLTTPVVNAPIAAAAKLLSSRRYIMLHPFAGNMRRCWSLQNWRELADKIRATNHEIVWMGRADETVRLTDAAPETIGDTFMWQMDGQKLSSTLAVTSRASALVGHDSGPIHFAAALGVPVLGLYLPSEYPRTVSQGEAPHQILWRQTPDHLSLKDVWESLSRILQIS